MSTDIQSLYSWTGTDDALEICGIECKGTWVELSLLVVVVLGQLFGWRWDFGLVDKWVEGLVQQGIKAAEAKRLKALDVARDVEQVGEGKKEVVVEEMVGGDIEKKPLLVKCEEKPAVEL